MRKTVILFLLLLSAMCFGQHGDGTIYLKNGTAKTGFISNTSDTNVTYKLKKKSKEKTKFSSLEIDSLIFYNDEYKNKWVFKTTSNNLSSQKKLVLVLVEGKLSLYRLYYQGFGVNGMTSGYLYLFGKNNKKITSIFGMNFKKKLAIEKYFYDCPKIIELVKKEAFKKYVKNQPNTTNQNRFIHMVNYYNSNCN